MPQESLSSLIDNIVKSLTFTSLLYPLQRLQTIKQIKSTYSDSNISQAKSILAVATHSGLSAYYRGFMSYITKVGILNASVKVSGIGVDEKKQNNNALRILNFGLSTLAYLITYPLQVVNVRISAETERERYYLNTRQCISKVKKNQGIKTLYRGFLWGYSIFAMQYASIYYLQNQFRQEIEGFSEWEKIGSVYGVIGLSELILYPLITLKKIYQINGAIGHVDSNFGIITALRRAKILQLWSGFQLRLTNVISYSLLFFLLEENQRNKRSY